jgi:hypothetical protein
MNFDFGKYWDTRIVPLLSTPAIKMCITRAIKQYLKYENPGKKYDKKHAPAWYILENDDYKKAYTEYETNITADLMAAGQIREKNDEESIDHYNIYIKRILQPYFEHFERTNMAAYRCNKSASFYWNTSVALQLAYLLEPNENWFVVVGNGWYATIINKTKTKMFDMFYYNENDASRGALAALIEVTRTDPRPADTAPAILKKKFLKKLSAEQIKKYISDL